ncbi:MAG: sigma-70 family RNA polymerase sigma factor [Planctomycetota bacterium]
MDAPTPQLAKTLAAAVSGDREAAAQLLPQVYDELRKLARARLSALPPGQTLGATALVHEAYLRVVGDNDPGWDHRGHFFGAAAQAMRDILVEQARRKGAKKRGGDRRRVVANEEVEPGVVDAQEDILAVNDALRRLEEIDPRKTELINLRYFVGLSNEEVAAVLGVSSRTVERDWRYVRAWLKRELSKS